MKRIELLTLSVVTATLIMSTGCSSDDDDNKASGPTAPSEVSTPVELNASVARNAMALIYWNGGVKPSPVRKGNPGGNDGNTSEGGTEVRDCDISGTETTTYSYIETDDGNGGGSEIDTESVQYDNCIDNDESPYDTRTYNGTYTWTDEESYDAKSDTHVNRTYTFDNYTDFRENNNSKISERVTYSNYMMEEKEISKEEISFAQQIMNYDGEYKKVLTNDDGNVTGGERTVYGALSMTIELVKNDHNALVSKKFTANGFESNYETNSTGDETLEDGIYVSNYMIHWYKPDYENNSNEEAVSVSGTIGGTCLGGSITISTDPLVRSNHNDYFDKDGHQGSSVLPYSGQQHISGTNSATVAYDFNSTMNTSATVTIGNESKKYGTWSEFLADNSCGEEK